MGSSLSVNSDCGGGCGGSGFYAALTAPERSSVWMGHSGLGFPRLSRAWVGVRMGSQEKLLFHRYSCGRLLRRGVMVGVCVCVWGQGDNFSSSRGLLNHGFVVSAKTGPSISLWEGSGRDKLHLYSEAPLLTKAGWSWDPQVTEAGTMEWNGMGGGDWSIKPHPLHHWQHEFRAGKKMGNLMARGVGRREKMLKLRHGEIRAKMNELPFSSSCPIERIILVIVILQKRAWFDFRL